MPDIHKKGIDAMAVMSVALKNIRLYPPASAMIQNTIQRAYHTLSEVFDHKAEMVYAESGGNFLVAGKAVSEKDQKRSPQILAFMDTVRAFGLKSITFQSDLEKEELGTFLELLSQNPEEEENEKELRETIEQKRLPHILMDHKVYVAVDADEQILVSIGIRDEDIVRYFVGDLDASEVDLEKIKAMAQNPQWVQKVFQAGMKHLLSQKGVETELRLAQLFIHMIRSLGEIIADENSKARVAEHMSQALAGMDEPLLGVLLTQDLEGVLGDNLFDHIVSQIPDEKFERLAARIHSLTDDAGEADKTYARMMGSDKGQKLQEQIRARTEREKEEREQREIRLRSAIQDIFKGDKAPFADPQLGEALAERYKALYQKKPELAQSLLDRLGEALIDADAAVRTGAARAVPPINRFLLSQGAYEPLYRLSQPLAQWLCAEGELTSDYRQICQQMQKFSQIRMQARCFQETSHILESFNRLYSDTDRYPEDMRELAGRMLKRIASDGVLDTLLKEFKGGEQRRREAGRSLSHLGAIATGPLLDILKRSDAMSERVRIINTISEMGSAAAPALVNRLQQGGPWYYLRNLIMMLGKVGDPAHVHVLKPFLKHDDLRVRREALNTLYNIGGPQRTGILLEELETADDASKRSIVDMLGALRTPEASPALVKQLESLGGKSALFFSKENEALKEKICVALGRIGSKEAIPALTAVAETRGLFGSENEELKEAARRALHAIRHHQVEQQDSREKPQPTAPKAAQNYNLVPPAGKRSRAQSLSPGEYKLAPPSRGKKERSPRFTLGAPAAGASGKAAPEKDSAGFTLGPPPPSKRHGQQDDDTVEETAVQLMLQSIQKYAREKRFEKAEEMKQKLKELDPMAMPELLAAEEVIAEEMDALYGEGELEKDVMDIFPELYESLEAEEAELLHKSFQEGILPSDQLVFSQASQNERLYFILEGRLKLVWTQGDREILLKTLAPGSIAGEDTFFSIALCTNSLITINRVRVNYLERNTVRQWRSQSPQLEIKLRQYCQNISTVYESLKQKGEDRRSQRRFSLSGDINAQLLDNMGNPLSNPFSGRLMDISAGGLAFTIRTSRKTARLLLGRGLDMKFTLPVNSPRELTPRGEVISVCDRAANTYSIHVKFADILDSGLLEKLATNQPADQARG